MPRIVITCPGRNPQPYRFQLDRQRVTLGRGADNDIVIDDGSVSVSHAAMERLEGGYQLRDTGSTNGIKIDGSKKEIITLRHGISVKVGDASFDFTLTDEERAALNREKPEEPSPIIKEAEIEDEEDGDLGGPRKAAPAGRIAAEVVYRSGPGPVANFFMTVLFLALAVGAFWIGMSLKYRQTHKDGSLLDAVKTAHGKPAPTAATPTEETPAPAGDTAQAPPAPAPAPAPAGEEPKKPE